MGIGIADHLESFARRLKKKLERLKICYQILHSRCFALRHSLRGTSFWLKRHLGDPQSMKILDLVLKGADLSNTSVVMSPPVTAQGNVPTHSQIGLVTSPLIEGQEVSYDLEVAVVLVPFFPSPHFVFFVAAHRFHA